MPTITISIKAAAMPLSRYFNNWGPSSFNKPICIYFIRLHLLIINSSNIYNTPLMYETLSSYITPLCFNP